MWTLETHRVLKSKQIRMSKVYVCIFLMQHPPSYHHDSFMSSSALGLGTPMCGHKLRAFKNPKSAKLPLLHQAT